MKKQYKEFKEYDPPVLYHGMKRMKDVYVEMRDGVKICIDINLPDEEGPFPALLSMGQHNKDLMDAEYTASMPASAKLVTFLVWKYRMR